MKKQLGGLTSKACLVATSGVETLGYYELFVFVSLVSPTHCGKPMRRSRSANRGSERRLSQLGSTLRKGTPSSLSV